MTRLSPVHGLVGCYQKLIQSFSLDAVRGRADADSHPGLSGAADVQRILLDRSFGTRAQVFHLIADQLLNNSDKLIPSITSEEIIFTELSLNYTSHLAEHLVADFVSKSVVNDLEVVQIKHYYLERPPVAPRSRSFLIEAQSYITRVGQASQRIRQRIRFGFGMMHCV